MAKQDEISSTERLLELIRTDSEIELEDTDKPKRRKTSRLKSLFPSSLSIKKNITIGVDLGHDDLKLVKVQRVSDDRHEMIEYARVPFDPEIPRESDHFHQFLMPTLSEFCGFRKLPPGSFPTPSTGAIREKLHLVKRKKFLILKFWAKCRMSNRLKWMYSPIPYRRMKSRH